MVTPNPSPSPSPDRLTSIVERAEKQIDTPDFNQKFKEELQQMKLTKEELSELAKRFESSTVERVKNDARNVILEQMKEERQSLVESLNPRTWSKETQQNAILATGGVIVAGGLLMWLSNKASKVTEGARNMYRKVRNGIMWTIGGTIAIAGTFLGIQAWQNWGEIKKQLARVEELTDKVKKSAEEAKEIAEKKLAEAQEKLEQLTGAPKSNAGEKVENAGAKALDAAKKAAPEAKNVGEKIAERAIGKGLALLHPDLALRAGLNVKEKKNDVSMVNGVMNIAAVRNLKMADLNIIAGFPNFQAARPSIENKLQENGLTQKLQTSELQAIYFLSLVSNAENGNLTAIKGKPVTDLTLESVLDQSDSVSRILMRIEDKMKDINIMNIADIPQKMSEVFMENISNAEVQGSETMRQNLQAIGLEKNDIPKFLLFAASQGSTLLSSVGGLPSNDEEEKKYVQVLLKLKEKMLDAQGMLKPEISRYVEQYAHGQSEFLEPLQERFGRLSITDAIQLYIYLEKTRDQQGKLPETIDGTSPVNALLLQLKILGMIGSMDSYRGEKMKAFLTYRVGQAGIDGLQGVNIPEPLKKTLPIVSRIIASGTKDKTKSIISTGAAWAEQIDEEKPWIKYVLGALGLDSMTKRFFLWRAKVNSRKLVTARDGHAFAKINEPTQLQKLRRIIPFAGTEEIRRANVEIAERVKNFDALGKPIVAETPKKTATAVEVLIKEMSDVKGKIRAEDIDAFLKLAAEKKLISLDKETMTLISESPKAKKIIAGAIETTEIAEITRALEAAKTARNWRVVGNALGSAGDVFGLYMAYADFEANGERIENATNTKNQALLDLYKNANVMYAVEGGSSVIGLTFGGIAIAKSYVGGTSVLTALGASGGTIMLPIGLAVAGGRSLYDVAEGASETWMSTSEDWLKKMSTGEMIQKLKELKSGTGGTYGQRLTVDGPTGDKQSIIEGANENTRMEITKAYLTGTSFIGKNANESDAQYKQRFDSYVQDRLDYERRSSEGTFNYKPAGYKQSRMYADLMAKSRDLKAQGLSELLTWKDAAGVEQSFNLAQFEELPWLDKQGKVSKQDVLMEYMEQQKLNTLVQFNLLERMPTGLNNEQKKMAVKQQLVMEIVDDLYKLDGRITAADFKGILSGEEQGKALARYTAAKLCQEAVEKETEKLLASAQKPEGVSLQEYAESVQNIRSELSKENPLDYQAIGEAKKYYGADTQKSRMFLSPIAIMNNHMEKATFLNKIKEETKEVIANATDAEILQQKEGRGNAALINIGAEHQSDGSYRISGGVGVPMYAKFLEGKWMVNFQRPWGEWVDPETEGRAIPGFLSYSTEKANRINNVLDKLHEINFKLTK